MSTSGTGIPAGAQSSRAINTLYFLLPPILALVLYRRGLIAWFQADDFAWLSLRLNIHSWTDLWHALFAPMAQGTIRPLSERAFFLIFSSLSPIGPDDALPFRICVFLTQCANLTLLNVITRRLTGSPAAGFCAAILWLVNNGLALPMVWTSTYNQILFGFFLMSAFWFLLRYIETGRRRDLYWQWAFFLIGFGALETNVIYPALAAAYTLCCTRKHFRTTLLLFIPSLLFTALHLAVAPAPAGGAYALHIDKSIPLTLFEYGRWALISNQIPGGWEGRLGLPFAWVLTIGFVSISVLRALRRDWLPVFCLSWFVILLAPVLPLRDHASDYYLALPTIGLAILGSYALRLTWRKPLYWKAFSATLAAAYLVLMVRADERTTEWWYQQSMAAKRIVLGVERAHELHPGKAILLDDLSSQYFWAVIFHHPFVVAGVPNVYLTPGSEKHIEPDPSRANLADYIMPGGPVFSGLQENQVVVYRMGPRRLKNITSIYRQTAPLEMKNEIPRHLDVGMPLMSYLLGPEWYALEGGYRWMPRRATFRLGGPQSHSAKLYLIGYCPEAALSAGPLPVNVTVDGIPLRGATLNRSDTSFRLAFDLPELLLGKTQIEVAVEAGRAFRPPGESRELGLAFGIFEVR